MIYPFTDADFTIHLSGADLTTAREIHVTLKQGAGTVVDVTTVTAEADGEGGCYLMVSLTQEQTQTFVNSVDLKITVNWITSTGKRPKPAGPVTVGAGEQLLRRIIHAD